MTYDLKVILMYCCGYSCKRPGLDPELPLELVLEPQFAVLGVLGASVGGCGLSGLLVFKHLLCIFRFNYSKTCLF